MNKCKIVYTSLGVFLRSYCQTIFPKKPNGDLGLKKLDQKVSYKDFQMLFDLALVRISINLEHTDNYNTLLFVFLIDVQRF